MTQDKSTPRPWTLTEDGDDHIIRGADDATVHHDTQYYPSGMLIADARLIVQAVNSHDAMKECVEALKEFVAIAERSEPGVNINFALALRKVKAIAALAKLEKANG